MLRWGLEDTASTSVVLKCEINVVNAKLVSFLAENTLRFYYTYRLMKFGEIIAHYFDFENLPCTLGSTQPLKMSTSIFLALKTAGA
jgi:hypothetical protein